MKLISSILFGSVILILVAINPFSAGAGKKANDSPHRVGDVWISAYLATWQHNAGTQYSNWGSMKAEDLDWDAFTHLIYFALNIGPDGHPSHSLDPKLRLNLNMDRINDIVPAAHEHGKFILLSVGGSGNYDQFKSAIRPENRPTFIATMVEFVTKHQFDGIDLDMEPIHRSDYRNYTDMVRELHAAFAPLTTVGGTTPLITIAALKGEAHSEMYASIQEHVDQINIMTYDMAQAWSGWQAWHNSALFSDGVRFDRNGRQMSSVKQKVDEAMNAGIERSKIGIGIDFYGYIWHGVHYLGKWDTWPVENLEIMERSGGVPYSELAERFDLSKAQWDSTAQTSYLEVDEPKLFVSFDNERSVQRKMEYVREEGLGGVILWELGGGYLTHAPAGTKSPLLDAIKESGTPKTNPQ